jgi:hypothetical protein
MLMNVKNLTRKRKLSLKEIRDRMLTALADNNLEPIKARALKRYKITKADIIPVLRLYPEFHAVTVHGPTGGRPALIVFLKTHPPAGYENTPR